MIINISFLNNIEKCFIIKNKTNISFDDLTLKKMPLNDLVNYTSIIQTDDSEKYFIKVSRSKHGNENLWRFILRDIIAERLLFTIRSLKEYRGSKTLDTIGIKTPKVYAAGFFLTNMRKYSGIIIYKKMENLISAQEFLLTSTSVNKKKTLLKNIEIDYKKMAKHKIHFRDFHMSNILLNPKTDDIYWIDAGLSRIF
ncbi:MAG: lipopolysaccharide kinase InaA family protein [Shewanella sp.]